MEGTWYEQRAWAIDYAISALPANHRVRQQITSALAALRPSLPDLTGLRPCLSVSSTLLQFSCRNIMVLLII
jgi:hypothetical protein